MKNYLKVKYMFAVLFSIINHLKCCLLFLGTRKFGAIITTTNTKPTDMVEIKYNTIFKFDAIRSKVP